MGHSNATSLSPMDYVMPRYYANLIITLRLSANVSFASVHEILQQSFRQTCDELPVLRRRVFNADNGANGVTGLIETREDENWVPEVVFNDLSTELPPYDEFVLEGLEQDALHAEMLLPPGVSHWTLDDKGVPVVLAQANYLEGGIILGTGIFHSVIDGASLMLLLKLWAANARRIQGEGAMDLGPQIDLHPDSCNYQLPEKLWSIAGGQKPSPADVATAPADVWRLAGLLHPDVTNEEISNGTDQPKMRTAIFYMPGASFDALRSDASTEQTKTPIRSPITANDALMALLWRSQMRARVTAAAASKDPAYAADRQTQLDTTFDGRRLFSDDLPWCYMGTMIFITTATMSIGELTSTETSLATIATVIRNSMDAISRERLHEAFGLASALPDYVVGKSLRYPYATFRGAEVMISSLVGLSAFDISFGDVLFGNGGRPDYLRPPRNEFDAICRRCVVLPMQVSRGFEVLMELKAEEMDLLMADDELRKYLKVVSCD
ncbi:transferase family-domain-containing protein [Xylaria longipes]|nr:transferase family-domain-containing protein [Xylaria longipes]